MVRPQDAVTHSHRGVGRGIAAVLPIVEWLPRYQRAWLPGDVIAGIMLAAYAIPVSLAYASLAGLPPHDGIYCYLVGGLGYALLGTSRQLAALRHLWRVSRLEFSISMVALAGVLLLGILNGVLVAVVASVLILLAAAARPHVAFLGRIPGTQRFSDLSRHPDNELVPRVLLFRVEASLLYFNVDHARNCVWEKVAATNSLQLVVCDLSNSPYVDVAGAAMLAALHKELTLRGIQLRIVEAHARARDLLRAEGLEEQVGYFGRHMSVDQAVVEFIKSG